MWDEDWALLGIEPTTQLAAIKKAYAARLKVTRPDDDAQAYQALRSAYERVQQWAAWERSRVEVPAGGPEAAPAVAEAMAPIEPPDAAPTAPRAPLDVPAAVAAMPLDRVDMPPAAAPAPAQTHEPLPAPLPDEHTADPGAAALEPRALIDPLELAWRRDGEAALLRRWADVRITLDEQPLARRAEFSAAFAHWLVNLPQLPDRFAAALNEHFGWLGDFRTERLIGPALAQAVQATLADRLPQPVDPALREAAGPLLRLAALRTGGWWRLHLVLFTLHPTLAQLLNGLGPALLRRLGLDTADQGWLRERIQRGLWMRAGLCTALVAGAVWLLTGNVGTVIVQTGYWLSMACGAMVVGIFLGAFINNGPGLTVGGQRRAPPLMAWRQGRLQPMLGLVWLLFAAWLFYMHGDTGDELRASPALALLPPWAWQLGGFGFALAGATVAWPLVPLHGLVVASIAPFVGYLADAALGAWLPTSSAVCIGMAWLLAGAAVFTRRLQAATPVLWLCRPVVNTLVLAERWSYSLAMLPMAAALAWLALRDGDARALTMFAIWALGNVATGWAQAQLDALAMRWLPAAPPEPEAG